LDAAQSEGIDVPGEAAILGVDNFHTICELSPVPLSSIAQDFCGMGYAAARQLDAAMENKKFRADGPVLMAPGRLVVRTSTDVLAFSDPVVVATLNLIHQHAAAGISMKQILREVPLSRKWLDQRFKTVVGHTPSREIRRCRMEQVRQLLIETDMPLRQIAVRCQFSCTENLIRCFRASFKVPPQTYRVQQRQGVVTR
jgi:LacI family transcriptional regulator